MDEGRAPIEIEGSSIGQLADQSQTLT